MGTHDPVVDEKGDAVARLVRELERKERDLAAAETRLHALIEKNADAILVIDQEGIVRFANPAAEKLFRRRRDELLGEAFGFPILAGETTEVEIVRRNGRIRWAEMRVVETEWWNEPALLATLRDITERKRARENEQRLLSERIARAAAEAAERRARLLADASRVLGASLDHEAALQGLARLLVPEVADWCIIDLVQDDDVVSRVAVAGRGAGDGGLAAELRHHPPDLRRRGELSDLHRAREGILLEPVPDSLLNALSTSEKAVTLLKRMGPRSAVLVPLTARGRTMGVIALLSGRAERQFEEADLRMLDELGRRTGLAVENALLYRAAQQANRAKSDFLAVVSHELRTPLNAVIGYADLLLIGVPPISDEAKAQIERILMSARHLLHLIDEVLTFAQMEAGREEVHVERVRMDNLIEEVISMIRPQASRTELELRIVNGIEGLELETDPSKVRQILLNLLTNAVKFTRSGTVELRVRRENGDLRIEVSDTGIGIPPEHLDRVFEPFWQVERDATRRPDGTGLGLSVARRLARLLGGDLTVDSRPGEGTTFTLHVAASATAKTVLHQD